MTPIDKLGMGELLSRYWDFAYAEGREGRSHDTLTGDAQETLGAIQDALTSLIAERDGLARENDISLEELGRIIMTLPTGTRTMGALQGVKELKARTLAAEAQLEAARDRVEILERTLGSATAQLEFLGVNPDGPTLSGYYAVLFALSLDTNKGDGE